MQVKYSLAGNTNSFEVLEELELDQAISQVVSIIREDLRKNTLAEAVEGSLEEHVATTLLMSDENAEEIDLGEIPTSPLAPSMEKSASPDTGAVPPKEADRDDA